MFKKIKKSIEKIQDSDEAAKKRWLIASSAVTMILVISLWLVYINNTIQPVNNVIEKQESEIGFWQIFKNGLNIVGESIWDGVKSFISKITSERTITIE